MTEPMDLDSAAVGLGPSRMTLPSDASDKNVPIPHAFHYNLPPHHKDPVTGVPYITAFCQLKAQELYDLAMSLRLTPETLYADDSSTKSTSVTVEDTQDDEDDIDDDDGEYEAADAPGSRSCRLSALGKQIARLQAQLTGLEQLKYSGFSQQQLCDMLLHLLSLVMCSVDLNTKELYFEPVGQVVTVNSDDHGNYMLDLDAKQGAEVEESFEAQTQKLERELKRPFALPTPTREVLLLIIVNILSNKGPLRAVSNAALYVPGAGERLRLVLHWKSFLRTLLRTAPYLDEHEQSASPSDSHTRQSNIVKRTSQMIRDARHFFDQRNDATARQVWDMVRTDCMYHSHTHACYRGSILLYLFQPSRCSASYYTDVLPQWLECWTNIDRCPEYDFLWLTLLCRARKHVSPIHDYDWGPIRCRLLTHAQYWLQLPIGGAAMDKSFPRAPNPRSRVCPSRLKAFTGMNSSYEEGIDFVAKVVKLLVAGLGSGSVVVEEGPNARGISEGTSDVLRFLSFVTPYFNPSNIGSWTFTLGAFLHYFAYELCCRFGAGAGLDALRATQPGLAQEYEKAQSGACGVDLPANELVTLLDALLPLCQLAIYSKNSHVGRAGEAAMLYLVQIDPARATPSFIDFAARALDMSAINMSHQAPAALSALTGLIQPSLRSNPAILLSRLPDILRLSLAGIDSNDQHKCIRTLILFRCLASWIPVGGDPASWGLLDKSIGGASRNDGTRSISEGLLRYIAVKRESPAYLKSVSDVPESSLLKQGVQPETDDSNLHSLLAEASSAMGDWALEFLERIFGLLRASGEREKRAKSTSGVASRHSSADVHQARNFSRVLTECLTQVFAAMDHEVHGSAVRAVQRFVEEETLSFAAKDAAIVCQAAAAARVVPGGAIDSPGLDALITTLTADSARFSTKTMIYRIRCLAGAVKSAGPGVIKHRKLISKTLDFALASDDRHLLKTGCKLLRHTLATLTESYPISSDHRPRLYCDEIGRPILGRSAQLHGDEVQWHIPDAECVEFFAELLARHVSSRLDAFCQPVDGSTDPTRSTMLHSPDIVGLRRCLRIIRYTIRGGAGLLMDFEPEGTNDADVVPYERSGFRLLDIAPTRTKMGLQGIRGRICSFLIVLSSVISSDTLYPESATQLPQDDPYRKTLPLIGADPKICKECCDLSLLLLTRRGAAFRSQEGRTIWKAQKQLATDFTLCAEVDRIVEVLQMGNLYGSPSFTLYKDGEDAGKTISRRLLVTRVQLFHNLLQRNASFQVPRRLRRYEREQHLNRNVLFCVGSSLSDMIQSRERMLKIATHRALDLYEGIVDGLFALCCHSNSQVRASAISVIDYALTRFGWVLAPRIPRLLAGIALLDKDLHGKFGVPSCAALSSELNQQGKRKRLSEAIKGICSILSLPRSVRQILGSWELRLNFVQKLCCTEELFSLLPTEELQKVVHYLQAIFSPFRSSIYVLPATNSIDGDDHARCINFVLGMLTEKHEPESSEAIEDNEATADGGKAHWRKLLFAAWFLLNFVDDEDISDQSSVREAIWSTCFSLIENNMGQPLQRVGLGILGKLASTTSTHSCSRRALSHRMAKDGFTKILAQALVFDHKEDTSVGGGHKSQWSSGVENILRDASRHLAPKSLFPFQRTSQSLGSFKLAHVQLVESILASFDANTGLDVAQRLLESAKELAAAPPSEDQRNQQITAAEIFAGVCTAFTQSSSNVNVLWTEILLPHLDEVVTKVPFSLCGAYFDGLRYSLQFACASSFTPLLLWLADKVKGTLWQPKASSDDSDDAVAGSNGNGAGGEGFTAQSKWLHLFSAVIIEMDESGAPTTNPQSIWYNSALVSVSSTPKTTPSSSNSDWVMLWTIISERLVPVLTEALGHPFDSCRDHIARALFWVCYSHRRLKRSAVASSVESLNATCIDGISDPSLQILTKMLSLRQEDGWMFVDRCNALNTTRRFISYCVHLGEAKFEYSEYVTPLLPLVFEALDSASEDEVGDGVAQDQDESTTRRALEAEVIKAYRYMISDISISAIVSYGRASDLTRILDAVDDASKHNKWQVRQGGANFLRCFQYAHKFLLGRDEADRAMRIAIGLLADERREVSSAAMAAIVGILAASSSADVARMVKEHTRIADRSRIIKSKKGPAIAASVEVDIVREKKRSHDQQVSVFFLVATVMSQPYDTPKYVPQALEAISKHSFERSAPLGVRDTVKKCCAEYKRTHMSDNWDLHRRMFSQEQLEAFEDVTSTPHYYA